MRYVSKATERDFWEFVVERHRITVRRKKGMPKPWTDDPILRDFKFTNIFREEDRHTVVLREAFRGNKKLARLEPGEFVFNVILWRWFNWIPTWDVFKRLSPPDGFFRRWEPARVAKALHARTEAGFSVWTNAYLVRGVWGQSKIDSAVQALTPIWKERVRLALELRESASLEWATQRLQQFFLVGPFNAYEFVTDLRHTPILEHATDILTWANPGPGAYRGLRRIWPTPVNTREKRIDAMRDLLVRQRAGQITVPNIELLPPMEMRDIEHSLCEFDKYWRVKSGDGKTRCLYNGRREDA